MGKPFKEGQENDKKYGEKIVGTSGISFVEKPPYYSNPSGGIGLLSSMYTDPAYRRMGIARTLLDKVVNEAKACG